MPTYSEIIRQQRKQLPREIDWWPSYLYHYTDVNNAVGIIEKEWLYDRKTAESQHLAKTDAASRNVLEVTGDDIKHCARLYMRPLTPTQFYNEGYKPDAVRHKDYKGADCPVTVFFLFDAAKTLSYPGVCFLEKGGAGRQIKSRCSGEEQFAALNFQKIYHHGPISADRSILHYRRTEVLRDDGLPLPGLLRRIVCLSVAEKETLFSMLQEQCPTRYEQYKDLITVAQSDLSAWLFFRHGIFVRNVKIYQDCIHIEFNEARLRYDQNKERKGAVPVQLTSTLYWKSDNGSTLACDTYNGSLDYKHHTGANLRFRRRLSDYIQLEIQLDGHLVYQNNFDIGNSDILF